MKKIFTKSNYLKHLSKSAKDMSKNQKLKQDAYKLISKADEYNWIHQTSWLGEPIINLPQDLFIIQEILHKTKPDNIIELGVAWGGQLLFYSNLMNILGGKKIIGVDIFIPNDLKKRLSKHKLFTKKVNLIKGSSTDPKIVDKISKLIGKSKKNLIILDSNHTHEHVLKELEIYSNFVGKNNYIICCDTIVEFIPANKNRPRAWKKGNNPFTAVKKFLGDNKRFKIDYEIDNKLLISCNYNGYLKAIKN